MVISALWMWLWMSFSPFNISPFTISPFHHFTVSPFHHFIRASVCLMIMTQPHRLWPHNHNNLPTLLTSKAFPKVKLRKPRKHGALRPLCGIATFGIYIVAFIIPIAEMLFRSIDNPAFIENIPEATHVFKHGTAGPTRNLCYYRSWFTHNFHRWRLGKVANRLNKPFQRKIIFDENWPNVTQNKGARIKKFL